MKSQNDSIPESSLFTVTKNSIKNLTEINRAPTTKENIFERILTAKGIVVNEFARKQENGFD